MCRYLRIGRVTSAGFTIWDMADMEKAERHEADLHSWAWHALQRLAHSLSREARIELTALMWFGRGDDDWPGCLAHARQVEPALGYVLGKPLPEYLGNALRMLGVKETVADNKGRCSNG
jgi:hypothetical protein